LIKAEFSLQSSVSHDPSEIILICWFAAYETFFIIDVKSKMINLIILWERYNFFSGFFDK